MGEVILTEKMVSVVGVGEGLNTGTFSLSPKTSQFKLFVYDSSFLQAIVPPLDLSVNAWKILCADNSLSPCPTKKFQKPPAGGDWPWSSLRLGIPSGLGPSTGAEFDSVLHW